MASHSRRGVFIAKVVITLYEPKYRVEQKLESVRLHGHNGTIMGMKLRSWDTATQCSNLRENEKGLSFQQEKASVCLSVCLSVWMQQSIFCSSQHPSTQRATKYTFIWSQDRVRMLPAVMILGHHWIREAEICYHAWKECNEVRKWKPNRHSRSENTLPLSTQKPVKLQLKSHVQIK